MRTKSTKLQTLTSMASRIADMAGHDITEAGNLMEVLHRLVPMAIVPRQIEEPNPDRMCKCGHPEGLHGILTGQCTHGGCQCKKFEAAE